MPASATTTEAVAGSGGCGGLARIKASYECPNASRIQKRAASTHPEPNGLATASHMMR